MSLVNSTWYCSWRYIITLIKTLVDIEIVIIIFLKFSNFTKKYNFTS